MKKIILTTLITSATAVGAFAQGTFRLDSTANTGTYGGLGGTAFNPGKGTGNPVYNSGVVSNGLVFTLDGPAQWGAAGGPAGNQLLGVDVNVTVEGGTSPTTLSTLFTLTLSGGTGTGDNVNWGQIQDPAGTVHSIPGVTAGTTGYLDLLIWEGTGTSYGGSGVYSGTTGAFAVPAGGGTAPPGVLNNMPDVELTIASTPEPSVFALSSIGAAALMLIRRKK